MRPRPGPRIPFRLASPVVLGAAIVAIVTLASGGDAESDARAHPATAVMVAAVMGAAAWRAGAVTGAGAVSGAGVAVTVAVAFGWAALWLLGGGLVLAVGATRFGRAHKQRAGLAEPRGGRRGAANVVANTGLFGAAAVAALAAGAGSATPAIAGVAALATGVGDTVASEVGQVLGGAPRLVTNLRRVPAGTPGAFTIAGLAAALAAAVALAAAAVALALVPATTAAAIVAGAVVASLLEGVVARSLEVTGWVDNHTVNLTATSIGAALAVALARIG